MLEHIKIGDIQPRVFHFATGSAGPYIYPFPIFKSADLKVYLDGVLQNSGYTVSGAGQSSGGSVSFDTGVGAPDAQVKVLLLRDMPIERTTDFQESGAFRAKAINDELDILFACLQQTNDKAGRAIRLAVEDSDTDLELPPAADRANKALIFDAEGNVSISADHYEDQAASVAAGAAGAEAAKGAAETAQGGAERAKDVAESAKENAETAAGNATNAASVATASQTNAADSETNAAASASNAQVAKIEWKGVWSAAAAYDVRDAVEEAGSSYICNQVHTGQHPPNAMYWDLLAEKGADGSGGGDLRATNNLSDLNDISAARTSLGLGGAATREVGVAAGSVAAGDHTHDYALDAFISENISITVGSSGKDFETVSAALASIQGKRIAPNVIVTILLAANDTIRETAAIVWNHLDSARIEVVGEDGDSPAETNITGQAAITGGSDRWRPTLTVEDASVIGPNNENSNYVIVRGCEPGLARTQEGCWKVRDNDVDGQGGLGGADRVQLENTYQPSSWRGGDIESGVIDVLTTKWTPAGDENLIHMGDGATLIVRNLAIVQSRYNWAILNEAGDKCAVRLNRVGINGGACGLKLHSADVRCGGHTAISGCRNEGIFLLEQSRMHFASCISSGHGLYGIHVKSGSYISADGAGVYGCTSRAIYLFNGATAEASSICLYGCGVHGFETAGIHAELNSTALCRDADVQMAGALARYGFASITGSYIEASGCSVSDAGSYAYYAYDQGRIKRGDDGDLSCSPSVNIEGNRHSYISSS